VGLLLPILPTPEGSLLEGIRRPLLIIRLAERLRSATRIRRSSISSHCRKPYPGLRQYLPIHVIRVRLLRGISTIFIPENRSILDVLVLRIRLCSKIYSLA